MQWAAGVEAYVVSTACSVRASRNSRMQPHLNVNFLKINEIPLVFINYFRKIN